MNQRNECSNIIPEYHNLFVNQILINYQLIIDYLLLVTITGNVERDLINKCIAYM